MQHARTFTVALLVAAIAALAALAPARAMAKTTTTTTTTTAKTATSKKAKVTSSDSIVVTCQRNGDALSGHYSLATLEQAYNSIPVAVREYTACSQVILDKINSETDRSKGSTSGGGGGSGFPVVIVLIIVVLLVGGGGALLSYRRSRGGSAE